MDEKEIVSYHLAEIRSIASALGRTIILMEVCGGHTNTIMRYGIRDILPQNIRLVSGPGCPVCVNSQFDIDCMVEIGKAGIPIATYGDMLRVPGSFSSLEQLKAQSGRVFEVYSVEEVLKLRESYPNIVFFGIGFETTAPMTAFLLKNNVPVYCVHKLIPPALKILLNGEVKIDGFILPGHVSTIIGEKPYSQIKIPQTISGFTPVRVIRAIRILLELIRDDRPVVANAYPEVVNESGNIFVQQLISEYFAVADAEWRGFGIIPSSGLEVKDPSLNAKIIYNMIIKSVPVPQKTACRCGDVLSGVIDPVECPMFKSVCTPQDPVGACMVSEEGSCSIAFRYGG